MRKTLVMLAIVAGLVAACSGSAGTDRPQASGNQTAPPQGTQGATTNTGGGTPKELDACSLITQAEAASALGEPVDAGTVPEPGAHSCLFSASTGITINSVEISITTGSGFDSSKKSIPGLTITKVSGIGDDAYTVSIGAGFLVLNVKKGQITFSVSVLRKSASNDDLLAAEKTLAMAILGRI
jgi:hypothetical protein